jgi:hypothetical protein
MNGPGLRCSALAVKNALIALLAVALIIVSIFAYWQTVGLRTRLPA